VKILSPEMLQLFFEELASVHDLRLPVLLADGTRSMGTFADGPLAMFGGALPAKPTALFFPHEGLIFCQKGDKLTPPPPPGKTLIVIGFTPRDLLCLRFIDRFFANGQTDDLYFRQREGAVICGVSGYCGKNGALLAPSNGEGDIEFIFDGANWLIVAYSELGSSMIANIPYDAPPDAFEEIKAAAVKLDRTDEELIHKAAALLEDDLVPDSFWVEISDRCILCTGCNLVCPTCTCFGVQDWRYAERMERSRMWDSCQLEGFMREAGGHNPMPTEADRTRRRIHHKLAADKLRWGEISCFLCGRCDATCPTGIGIVAVSREMVARYGIPV
jgi:ferredoxin